MGRTFRVFFFLAVCLGALVPLSFGEIVIIIEPDPGDDPVININPVYDISGFVMDLNGNAVSGVSVALSGAVAASAITAGDGSYRFTSLAENGSYTITPSMTGMTFIPVAFSTASLSGTIANANFTAALLPPPPPPPSAPKTIVASVDIDPNTLNLKSNRQYITAYIELPSGYDAKDIKVCTVKITAINGKEISTVPALTSKSEKGDYDADGIPDLMVKFDYDLVSPLLSAGNVTLRINGDLCGADSFTGEDTITVIKERESDKKNNDKGNNNNNNKDQNNNQNDNHHDSDSDNHNHNDNNNNKSDDHNDNGDKNKDNLSSSSEKQYSYSLKQRITSGARIRSVRLWKKAPNVACQDLSLPAWHYKAHRDWESVAGNRGNLRYGNMKKGKGCEWDLTDKVSGDWTEGIADVVVKVDEKNGDKPPVLVVAYDPPDAAPAAEETVRDKQKLKPVGKEVEVAPTAAGDNVLEFTYEESDIQGISEKDLAVYYWDATQSQWQQAPDSTVNTAERSITCTAVRSTRYQAMARAAVSANQQQPEQVNATNALGQNYPNPFNPATTIEYSIARDCHVTLKIYNVAGELIATVVDENQGAGSHSVHFDGGAGLSRGIYYYQLKAGDYTSTKRMVVLK